MPVMLKTLQVYHSSRKVSVHASEMCLRNASGFGGIGFPRAITWSHKIQLHATEDPNDFEQELAKKIYRYLIGLNFRSQSFREAES